MLDHFSLKQAVLSHKKIKINYKQNKVVKAVLDQLKLKDQREKEKGQLIKKDRIHA